MSTNFREGKAIWPKSDWSRNRGAEHQFELDALTIMLGGHLRVGMEDNLFISPGRLASGSVEFVRRVKKLCGALGREMPPPARQKKSFSRIRRTLRFYCFPVNPKKED